MRNLTTYLVGAVLALTFASCAGQKMMLTTVEGPLVQLLDVDTSYAHVLRPDDKVSLSIWDHDDLSIGSVYSIYNANESYGKWILVDKHGNAQLPKLGSIPLGGKTVSEAADTLRQLYGREINKPVVVLKVLNRNVTVLGEVKAPGMINLEKERTSITEIIGRAEGFTNYSNIKHIRLIRNDISYTINLRQLDDQFLNNIVMQADDILIIPAKRGKTLDQKAPTLIPFSSALTALVLVVSILI